MVKGISEIAKLTQELTKSDRRCVVGFYNYEEKEYFGDIVNAAPLEQQVRYPYYLAFTLHAAMTAETLQEYIENEIILPSLSADE